MHKIQARTARASHGKCADTSLWRRKDVSCGCSVPMYVLSIGFLGGTLEDYGKGHYPYQLLIYFCNFRPKKKKYSLRFKSNTFEFSNTAIRFDSCWKSMDSSPCSIHSVLRQAWANSYRSERIFIFIDTALVLYTIKAGTWFSVLMSGRKVPTRIIRAVEGAICKRGGIP